MAKRLCVIILVFVFGILGLWAQENGDYRSVMDGSWHELTSWERFDGSNWIHPANTPTSSNGTITILNGHRIFTNTDVTIDQTIIEAGGTLHVTLGTLTIIDGSGDDLVTFGLLKATQLGISKNAAATIVIKDGGTYEHNRTFGAIIPSIIWEDGSTCLISKEPTTNGFNSSLNQNHYNLNFFWNNSTSAFYYFEDNISQIIRGSLSILGTASEGSVGLGNTSANRTLTINKDLLIMDGVLEIKGNSSSSGNQKIVVLGDYIQSGGMFRMSRRTESTSGSAVLELKGNFLQNAGTISNLNATHGIGQIIFSKSGTQTFTKTGGTIAEKKINFTVNSGSTLDLGTSVIDGSTGTFTLSSGAGLITAHPDGISAGGTNTGSIQVTGSRSYHIAADYTYNGTVAQITGSGQPVTVRNLTIANPAGVSLSNNLTVNNALTITAGSLHPNGKSLTVKGAVIVNGGSLPPNVVLNAYENTSENISIAAGGGSITNLSVSSNPTGSSANNRIKRTWTISGTQAGSKLYTFTWSAADDYNFNWGAISPRVYQGANVLERVSSGPRSVTVRVESLDSKADFSIGREDNQTLPVELSSFSADYSARGDIRLCWQTQSETNLQGFYIFRSQADAVAQAALISGLISASNSSTLQSYVYDDKEITATGTYYYWLQSLDFDGSNQFHGPISFYYEPAGGNASPDIPLTTALSRIYPNPFNPTATISFSLAKLSEANLKIYNTRGQIVRGFDLGTLDLGWHQVVWDGKDYAGSDCGTGLYLVVLEAGGIADARKVTLVK